MGIRFIMGIRFLIKPYIEDLLLKDRDQFDPHKNGDQILKGIR